MLKTLAGENVVINVGPDSADFSKMIRLNGTAAFMWRQLEAGKTPEETARAVAQEYGIAPEKAEADVKKYAAELLEKGLAE